jgi:hypothetical protein
MVEGFSRCFAYFSSRSRRIVAINQIDLGQIDRIYWMIDVLMVKFIRKYRGNKD